MNPNLNESADEILNRAYSKAKAFFMTDLPSVELFIVKDKASILNEAKQKKKWEGTGFFRKNTVVVLDKSFFRELGYEESEFDGVVLHELSHIFIKHVVGIEIPIWIEEGLCNYIAFPKVKPKKIINLTKLNTLDEWDKNDTPFVYCSCFFYFLEEKYGKEKLLEFIKKLNEKNLEDSFLETFGTSFEEFVNKYNKYIEDDLSP